MKPKKNDTPAPPAFYSTPSMHLSAFLKAHGLIFTSIKEIPGSSRVEFVFDTGGQDAVALAQKYYGGGEVPAKAFTEALFDLRGSLFNLRK